MKKENNVLELVEKKISFKTKDNIDPQEFFQDRKGLYVFNSFIDRVSSKAKPVKKGTPYTLTSSKLLQYSTDEQIEAELPEKHIFSEDDVCAILADLIEKQSKGEEGVLASDGNWNLFYTESFVVFAGWRGGGWYVGTWSRDYSAWHGSPRVFSPATGK